MSKMYQMIAIGVILLIAASSWFAFRGLSKERAAVAERDRVALIQDELASTNNSLMKLKELVASQAKTLAAQEAELKAQKDETGYLKQQIQASKRLICRSGESKRSEFCR